MQTMLHELRRPMIAGGVAAFAWCLLVVIANARGEPLRFFVLCLGFPIRAALNIIPGLAQLDVPESIALLYASNALLWFLVGAIAARLAKRIWQLIALCVGVGIVMLGVGFYLAAMEMMRGSP
jgi:hypothetical protein